MLAPHLNRVLLQQKRVVRIIFNVLSRTHTQFQILNILRIEDLYTYSCALFIYRLNSNFFPTSFSNIISRYLTPRTTPYHTRSTYREFVEIPYCRTSMRQKSLAYAIPNIYNNVLIPNNLLSCPTIHTFKRAVRRHLLSTYL